MSTVCYFKLYLIYTYDIYAYHPPFIHHNYDPLCLQVSAKVFSETETNKIRLAYPREVTERKAIKEVLVRVCVYTSVCV